MIYPTISTANIAKTKTTHKYAGWVYFVYCKHIGDIEQGRPYVKIGVTNCVILDKRMEELRKEYRMPEFIVLRAIWVQHAEAVERTLHKLFEKYRVWNNREFFDVWEQSRTNEVMCAFDAILASAGELGVEWNRETEYSADNLPGNVEDLVFNLATSVSSNASSSVESSSSHPSLDGREEPIVSTFVGEAFVGSALVGEALVSEALVGEALVSEAFVGDTLVGDTLVGEALDERSAVSDLTEPATALVLKPIRRHIGRLKSRNIKTPKSPKAPKAPKVKIVVDNPDKPPKFAIKTHDGLEVYTAALCYTPDLAQFPEQTLTLKVTWSDAKNSFVDEAGRELGRRPSDIASHHSKLLGWANWALEAKRSNVTREFAHMPGEKPSSHGPTYSSYPWRRAGKRFFTYKNERGELRPIEEISYAV